MLIVSEFSSALRHAVDRGDSQLLKVISDDWGDHIMFMPGHLEDGIFQVVIEIMRAPGFQAMDGAQHLLFRFVSDWAALSRDQKRILLPVLEETYPHYASSTACFFISVVLGERYHNSRALDVLIRLSKVEAEMPRSLVPHGLEHIVTAGTNEKTSRKALQVLRSMQDDVSSKVRGEVELSLGRLLIRGYSRDDIR